MYKRKRINYAIKTQMQVRLFLKMLSVSLVGVGLMAAIFYFYSDRAINNSFQQFHVHAQNFLDLLMPAIILSLLAAVILSAVIALTLPIKYAGPMFRIERELRGKVGAGDLTVRFKLRKGDEVKDLADAINDCLESLEKRIVKLKSSAEDLDTIITNTDHKANEEIRQLITEMKEELGKFTVK